MFLTSLLIGAILSISIMLGCGHFSLPLLILIIFIAHNVYKLITKKFPESEVPDEYRYIYRLFLSGIFIGFIASCVYIYFEFLNSFINNLLS